MSDAHKAIQALNGLIAGMQEQLRAYLQHEIDADAFIGEIAERLDGPEQREAKRLAEQALKPPSGGVTVAVFDPR